MALLTCEDITLGYDKTILAEHVSFEVSSGDYLCIVGENGSGKTTLMRTLAGLRTPLRGSLRWGDGMDATQIGYLPQQTQVQRDFPASVWEIVLSGCRPERRGSLFCGKPERQMAETMLEKLSILPLRNRCYRELSGGQQQRVLLARALCATKKLLLLDEPVAGLDPGATVRMYELIEKLNREDGLAIIMISHDMTATERYADYILHIGGQISFGRNKKKEEV